MHVKLYKSNSKVALLRLQIYNQRTQPVTLHLLKTTIS